jgi:small subunit ribosomal protein S1
VVSITNYGAFVELEKGVEGLVHISEMSWTRNVKHPSKLVSIGDEIEAVVLKVDRDEEKISLGMKQIEEDPWLALPEKYPVSTRVEGKVRNLTSFGAFVEIEPGIDGLIHISDMSWTKRVQHPSEVVHKGEDVSVMVLGVDPENKRISLGLKQTQDDPWPEIATRMLPGVEQDGKVVRLLDDGVVVDLGDEIEGFVPKSQVPVAAGKDLSTVLGEGQTMGLRILECDAGNHRIVLTVTEMPEPPAKKAEPEAAEGEDAAEASGSEESPAAEAATAEAAVAEAPAAEAAEAPADEVAAEEPAAEAPADEAAEEPAAEAPADEAAEAPAAEAPADETAEAPAAEAPADETADVPSDEAPAEEPVAEAEEEPAADEASEDEEEK